MARPPVCVKCRSVGKFYTEGNWVKCLKCDANYSQPSKRELVHFLDNGYVRDGDQSGLMHWYEFTMLGFEEFRKLRK